MIILAKKLWKLKLTWNKWKIKVEHYSKVKKYILKLNEYKSVNQKNLRLDFLNFFEFGLKLRTPMHPTIMRCSDSILKIDKLKINIKIPIGSNYFRILKDGFQPLYSAWKVSKFWPPMSNLLQITYRTAQISSF